MDTWKFYDITHRGHVLCNPMSLEKLDRLIGLLRLESGARVLDMASGKGEFVIRLAERYGVSGIGVDISPFFVADARKRLSVRAPGAQLSFVEMEGAKFVPERWESFDLVSCIGASWIFNGHRGTLEFLVRAAAPGGWVVVGEPHWLQDPPEEYLKATGDSRDLFATHAENVAIGEECGLRLVHTIAGNKDDWDQYEGLQWLAAENFSRSHPDDPDVAEVMERVARDRAAYLKWGRETLGWAIYAFRKPGG
jgi:SAM-dependent methyltransferase